MHRPVILWLTVGESGPVKGITTETVGLSVKVSVLRQAAEKLGKAAEWKIGSPARLVFHSDEYGDTPGIGGRLIQLDRSESSVELSIEIDEWDRLARFWDSVIRH